MDPSLVVLMECLDDIKTKISDNEYKTMIEELQKINNNYNLGVKKYEVVITYHYQNSGDQINPGDKDYQVEISKKRQRVIRSAEFDNFCRSNATSRMFKHDGSLLKKLLVEHELDEEKFEWIMYFTIFKLD